MFGLKYMVSAFSALVLVAMMQTIATIVAPHLKPTTKTNLNHMFQHAFFVFYLGCCYNKMS